jgi:streptogramin lyase
MTSSARATNCIVIACALLAPSSRYSVAESLLVADSDSHAIIRYSASDGLFVDPIVPPRTGGMEAPFAMAVGPDGDVYVTSYGTSQILRYDATLGTFMGVFIPANSGGLVQPFALTFGPDGNLYVTPDDITTQAVFRFNGQTGAFMDVFVTTSFPGAYSALAFAPNGNLFLVDLIQGGISEHNGQTGALIQTIYLPAFHRPFDIAFGPDGNMYLTNDTFKNSIAKLDGQTGAFLGYLPSPTDTERYFYRLAFGNDGRLYATDRLRGVVHQIDISTGDWLGEIVARGGIDAPTALAFGPDASIDCNRNGVDDLLDLTTGTSADTNTNGVPDECERLYVRINAANDQTGLGWNSAYGNLQFALDHASNGRIREIWVAEGTYMPQHKTEFNFDRSATFPLAGNTALYGGFAGTENNQEERDVAAHPTFLSGDLAGNDGPSSSGNSENAYHVLTASLNDTRYVVDGFVITRGNAVGGLSPGFQPYGGGLYMEGNGELVIRNCRIQESWAESGGGLYANASSVLIKESRFVENGASHTGGGIWIGGFGETKLIKCELEENVNGGLIHKDYSFSPSHLESCAFFGNSEYGAWLSIAQLINCMFIGNEQGIRGNNLTVDSSTVVMNTDGGGISASECQVTNSILWGNSNSQGSGEAAQVNLGGNTVVRKTLVQGLSTLSGNGNINADPLFVDPDGIDGLLGTRDDDLRLLQSSPCIDVGSNGLIPNDVHDLDGDGDATETIPVDLSGSARIADGNGDLLAIVDMGAYERFVVAGDIDQDGDVDLDDHTLFVTCLAGPGEGRTGDLDGDGTIDLADFDSWVSCFTGPAIPAGSQCVPMDLDGDDDVDLKDFALLGRLFDGPDGPVPYACRPADVDHDNDVDLVDYAIMQERFTGPN